MRHSYHLALSLAFAVALTLSSVQLDAQSAARVALVEQVTSASCGPCASQNPAFRTLLNNNLENVAIIKYQRGGGGYLDPMWSFNPTQVDSRITGYYGTYSFPQAWINGTYYGSPNMINQADIDDEMSSPAWWDIDISQALNEAQDELSVSVNFKALRDFQESTDAYLRGFVVVIEDEVNYSSPPGYNSEKNFYWVMRKMLTGTSGAIMGKQLEGEETAFDFTYPIDLSKIDPSRLRVIAFVQTLTTKEVHQAATYRESLPSGVDQMVLGDLSLQPTLVDQMITLSFSLTEAQTLRTEIYDLQGRLVEDLGRNQYASGTHQQTFVLGDYPAGTYFAMIRGQSESRMARFVVAQ